jgi:FkbM family methyltransferase
VKSSGQIEAVPPIISRFSGDMAIDVGSHHGEWALGLARRHKVVIAVEPNPHLAQELRQKMTVEGIENIDVVEAAASDREGVSVLHVHRNSFSSLRPQNNHLAIASALRVKTITVDEMVWDSPESVDLIKIDAAGHEPEILRGALKTLLRHHPALCVEMSVPELHSILKTMLPGVHFEKEQDFFVSDRSNPKLSTDFVANLRLGCPFPGTWSERLVLNTIAWAAHLPSRKLEFDALRRTKDCSHLALFKKLAQNSDTSRTNEPMWIPPGALCWWDEPGLYREERLYCREVDVPQVTRFAVAMGEHKMMWDESMAGTQEPDWDSRRRSKEAKDPPVIWFSPYEKWLAHVR